jgi:hypothetical protein
MERSRRREEPMKNATTSIKASFGLLPIAVASVVGVVTFGAAQASASGGPPGRAEGTNRCTMAVPAPRTTVMIEMPNAGDFCELASQALSADVFHTAVLVTDGQLWRYSDAAISCRLRYGRTDDRITVHNSTSTCRWFRKHATGWHQDRNKRSAIA